MSSSGDDKVKDSEDQKALARIAAEKMQFFDEELAPLQELYFQRNAEAKSPGQKSYLTGRVNQATEQAFGNAANRIRRQSINSRVDPDSGAFKADVANSDINKARSSGESQALAEVTQDDEYVSGLTNVLALGSGKSTEAQEGINRIAQYSQQKAVQDASDNFQSNQDRLAIAGSAAGAGAWWLKNKNK